MCVRLMGWQGVKETAAAACCVPGAAERKPHSHVPIHTSCTDAVLAVAWSPAHPDLVASGGQDDKAFIWRVSLAAAAACVRVALKPHPCHLPTPSCLAQG